MTTHLRGNLLVIATLSVGMVAPAADMENVAKPQVRQEVLDLTKELLAAPTLPAVGKDPFHSEAYADSIAGHGSEGAQSPATDTKVTVGPRGAHDLLQAIATSPSLKPSGYFVLGGQPTLVFGQKRVKAGSFLTITFEGAEYTLEIVSIDRPNFTLRLNREEFTRPIK